jgi:methionyl-tRNA synthetase
VATFGNLVHRVLTQVYRNFDEAVPNPDGLRAEDEELIAKANAALEAVGASIEAVRLREAINLAMGLARDANKYIDSQAPWKQVKEDMGEAARTLFTSLYAISALKTALYPFLPFTAQKLHEAMGLFGDVTTMEWTVERPVPGTRLPQPAPLFTKLDDSVVADMVALLGTRE